MKSVLLLVVIFFFSLISPVRVNATVDPSSVPNNRFGIHILDENDLHDAARLVNSSGGDWGYVTFVVREDERDLMRWQRVFDTMREKHLIPIIRIATKQTENGWSKGSLDEIEVWTEFLSSLEWVTQNRYVIIGNETNHANEWEGEISPEAYTDYLIAFSKRLKRASDDFFILPAGLDAAAPNDARHMDSGRYIRSMYAHREDVFEYIDGWSSHSYPNPGFVGSVDDTGKRSVRGYEWELDLLTELGVERDLPVFITETGWAHDYGGKDWYINSENVSQYFEKAYGEVWDDQRVVAVTPFLLTYPGDPVKQFSWRKPSGKFYEFYYRVQEMEKMKGEPILDDYQPEVVRQKEDYVYNLNHNHWVA